MAGLTIKRFTKPDETRPFKDNKGRGEVLKFKDQAVLRATFEPGWRWSEHIKPIANTPSCQTFHAGYVVSGRMHIRMDDGQEGEIGPGDVMVCEPGHDAWVLGDEACVILDFGAIENYARPSLGAPAQRPATEQPRVRH